MSSVDNRIVNMQFNNKQFESGANQSKRTLAGLESAVNRTGKSSGLNNLANGATTVRSKFSAMQVMGVTALATITNKAVNAGIGLVKSLAIDPILQGWSEYNTNLQSIQTVMANTGKGIKPVQNALNQLNHYSDLTIYNFSEMAKNVGTFTAAGVGLKQSVSSIQGIANIAALSGSSSQQASTAMYQLSQAIAAGRVNLQDWNSVVNAGMGGKKLQTALVQTGIAMGKVDGKTVTFGKNIKIAGESFRSSISAKAGGEAWLGSDVLVKTLALMDGRLSMTAQKAKLFAANQKLAADQQLSSTEITKRATAEITKQQKIMAKQGYTPAQIKSLTTMAEAAVQSATTVKTLPQLMGVIKESIGSVWSNAFSGIVGNFQQSKKLWSSAAQSVQKITTGFSMSMNNMIFMWKKGFDGIKGRTAVIDGFKAVFKTLGSILKTVGQAFRDVFPPSSVSVLAKISVGFMRLAQALVPSEATLKSLRSIFGGIFAILHIGVSLVVGIAAGFKAMFGAMFAGSGKAGGGVLSLLGTVGEMLKAFDKMLTSGGKMTDFFTKLGTIVGGAIHPVVAIIGGLISSFSSLVSGGGGVGSFFTNMAKGLGSVSVNGDKIVAVFKSIGDSLQNIDPSKLKATFSSIGSSGGDIAKQGIQIASGIISGIAQGLATAAPQIMSAVSALGSALIAGIKGVLGIHSPATTMIPVGQNVVMGIAKGIADGISALPAAFSKIGNAIKGLFKGLFGGMNTLDFASLINAAITGGLLYSIKKLSDGIGGFTGLGDSIKSTFGGIKDALKSYQTELKAKMIMEIALAVGVLTASIIALSFVKPAKIAIALGAISAMMGTLVGTMALLSKVAKGDVNMAVLASSILLISGAMINLSVAVAILGNLDMSTLAKGLGAMAIAMGIMAGSMAVMGSFGAVGVSAGAGIALMAAAMVLLAGAVLAFGSMDIPTLAKGLGSIAIAMIIFTASLAALGAIGPGVLAGGAGILMVAGAMVILAGAVAIFGNMDIGTLAKGLGAIAIALILFTASLALLGAIGPGTLAAGGAMILMATAMGMLVPVVAMLGSMDWGTLAKGIGALAVILALFVVAVAALGAVAMVVGPGLLMFGAALALAGVGMLAFGTGFALMAAAGTAGVAVLTAAFAAIIALLPSLAVQVAAALTSMIETFAKAAPRWHAAMNIIIKNMLGVITDNIPHLAKLLSTMITAGLGVLKKAVPQFVETGLTIITRFLKSIASHVGDIVKYAVQIAVNFMNAIGNQAGRLADAGARMIIKFVNAIAKAIRAHDKEMGTAGGNLAVSLAEGMVRGLVAAVNRVITAAKNLAGAAVKAIHDKILNPPFPSRVTMGLGYSMGVGLAVGIDSGIKPTVKASYRLADAAINSIQSSLEIASPSKKARWWGEMIGQGLATGLANSTKPTVKAALDMVNAVIAAGDKSVLSRQRASELALATATREQTFADILKQKAAIVPAKNKAAKKAALAAAAKQQTRADNAKKASDSAQAAVDSAIQYRDADAKGKADILQAQATANADRATQLMAKAGAESEKAKALAKTNAKLAASLRAQALRDATAAKTAAQNAKTQQAAALRYYAVEVKDRIKAIEDAAKADKKAKADQAELDAASTPQAKADILNKRASVNDALAATLQASADALISKAKALAGKDAVAAGKLVDRAEQAAADAKAAADQADQQRQDATSALGADTAASPGANGGATPSRSILEDAASIVDRYTASLIAAQELAVADQPVLQFVQNNTSPEALSVSEVYRQTNNLVSLAANRLTPKPSGTK